MPRRRRHRRIVAPPGFQGYKPYGTVGESAEHISLFYEEYEAIKLADYDLLKHEEACELMGVSRATFARIYESARRKIALALVETREIKTVFGNAVLDNDWLFCHNCSAKFTMPSNLTEQKCPVCKSDKIDFLNKLKI